MVGANSSPFPPLCQHTMLSALQLGECYGYHSICKPCDDHFPNPALMFLHSPSLCTVMPPVAPQSQQPRGTHLAIPPPNFTPHFPCSKLTQALPPLPAFSPSSETAPHRRVRTQLNTDQKPNSQQPPQHQAHCTSCTYMQFTCTSVAKETVEFLHLQNLVTTMEVSPVPPAYFSITVISFRSQPPKLHHFPSGRQETDISISCEC